MASETAPSTNQANPRPNTRILWRLGGWGVVAALALAAAALASQSVNGSRGLDRVLARADLTAPPVATLKIHPPDKASVENKAEIKHLTAQLHQLAEDRDRLSDRVAGLEHQLDDLTGSIKLLAAVGPLKKAPPPAPKPPATTAATGNLPVKHVVTTAITAPPVKLSEPPAKSEPAQTTAAIAAPMRQQEKMPALEKIPLPPVRLAETEPAKSETTKPAMVTSEPTKPQFAIALAGSASIAVARLQWAAVKANFGSLLGKLEPRAISERHGGVRRYRLVIGPLPSYTEATKLCAHIVAAHALCQPTKFTGEPL